MTTENIVQTWLEGMAESNQSTMADSAKMQNLLRRVGFPKAVVVSGIVYLEGRGTMQAPPASIHSVAKMLAKITASPDSPDGA